MNIDFDFIVIITPLLSYFEKGTSFLKINPILFCWSSSLGASSGARVFDAVLACSASKDFCKDSLTLNDEIGQRRFQRYSRVLDPQTRINKQSSPLNGVGKFLRKENVHPFFKLVERSNSMRKCTGPPGGDSSRYDFTKDSDSSPSLVEIVECASLLPTELHHPYIYDIKETNDFCLRQSIFIGVKF